MGASQHAERLFLSLLALCRRVAEDALAAMDVKSRRLDDEFSKWTEIGLCVCGVRGKRCNQDRGKVVNGSVNRVLDANRSPGEGQSVPEAGADYPLG